MNNKIAILLWLYHTDLYQELINYLLPLKDFIHLYLGLCNTDQSSDIKDVFDEIFSPHLTVEWYNNSGADILPFLHQLRIAQNHHKYFIKLHSKKSYLGYNKQINWLNILLNDLLTPSVFERNINRLEKNYHDMIGSRVFIYNNQEYYNHEKIIEICNIINLQYSNLKRKTFVAGNIFIAKCSMFDPFIAHFDALKNKLEKETGHVIDTQEGKYSHSMERIFGYVGSKNKKIGYSFLPTKIILTPKISHTKKLHMVELKNQECYILENVNIYGKITQNRINQDITINWLNTEQPECHTKYKYFNHKTLINYAYS